MGFVGRNGAGKSTTIKSMLRLVKPDCGEVKMFGMDYAENEEECKKHLGIVLGEFDYYADKKLKTVTGVVRRFYPNGMKQHTGGVLQDLNWMRPSA